MGASGAGKTSLLNILADRISLRNGSELSGDIIVNDKQHVTQDNFGKFGSYVVQDDILFSFLTVRESLLFAADMGLACPKVEKELKVI